MPRRKFREWVENNIELWGNQGISTEFVILNGIDMELISKPFTKIIQETELCLGQIIVYESREMDFEVIHIQTEELLLWKYIESIDDDFYFGMALNEYFNTLKNGTQPVI